MDSLCITNWWQAACIVLWLINNPHPVLRSIPKLHASSSQLSLLLLQRGMTPDHITAAVSFCLAIITHQGHPSMDSPIKRNGDKRWPPQRSVSMMYGRIHLPWMDLLGLFLDVRCIDSPMGSKHHCLFCWWRYNHHDPGLTLHDQKPRTGKAWLYLYDYHLWWQLIRHQCD